MAKLSKTELKILTNFAQVLPTMSSEARSYLLGYGDAMVEFKRTQEQETYKTVVLGIMEQEVTPVI